MRTMSFSRGRLMRIGMTMSGGWCGRGWGGGSLVVRRGGRKNRREGCRIKWEREEILAPAEMRKCESGKVGKKAFGSLWARDHRCLFEQLPDEPLARAAGSIGGCCARSRKLVSP